MTYGRWLLREEKGERSRIELPPATLSIVSGRRQGAKVLAACFLNPSFALTKLINLKFHCALRKWLSYLCFTAPLLSVLRSSQLVWLKIIHEMMLNSCNGPSSLKSWPPQTAVKEETRLKLYPSILTPFGAAT